MERPSMKLTINLAASVPIYRQIATQIRYLVASGLLAPDAGLPSIRALALELKVAPTTIAKAYEELEVVGVVRRRRGFGTFVSFDHAQTVDWDGHRIVEKRIDALLAEARQLHFTEDALLALIHRRQACIALEESAPAFGE
jgi:GntR family transcriptional regulator